MNYSNEKIEAILQCQGKPTNFLSSFLDLECDLESFQKSDLDHPEKRKTALSPYVELSEMIYKD